MKLLVVSNMFPSEKYPSYGIFVKKFCDELDMINIEYQESVMKKTDGKIKKIVSYLIFYLKTIFLVLFEKYDVIYVHYASYSSIPVLLANRIRKKDIYVNVHGSDVVPENRKHRFMNRYTNKILQKSKKIIVPSEYFKNYVIHKYLIKDVNKIFVFPSAGIDRNVFYKKDAEMVVKLKQDYNILNSKMSFGMAGRITKDKGWDVFIKAIEIVIGKGAIANFIIVGDGNEKKELLSLIKNKNLEEYINLIDYLPQSKLADFYLAIDYFVFPTKREGESLGLVALEAMACGTPVISSNFAAPKYYIHDKENGYKFEVGNENALAEIIMDLILKGEIDSQLQKKALKTASSYYVENIIQNLKNIIENR